MEALLTTDQSSDQHFKHAFEQAAVGIALMQPDGRFQRANAEYCKFVGYSEAELKRFSFQHVIHKDDLEACMASTARMLAGGISAYHAETRYMHSDGEVVWGLLSNSLVRDRAGKPLRFVSVVQDITERKRAEEEMRRIADLARSLANGKLAGVFAFDRNCCYTVWNPGMEAISGISKGETLGRSAFEIFPFLMDTGEEHFFHSALEGKNLVARDRIYSEPETYQERFYEAHYSPVYGGSGDVVGGIAILHETSERRATQDELERTLARYQAVCDHASDLISVQNLKSRYLFVSESCAAMLGYQPGEMAGTTAYSYIHPDDIAAATTAYGRYVAGSDEPSSLRYRVRHKDGEYIWVETHARPIEGTYGMNREVLCVTRQVHEEARDEAALLEEQKVAEDEAREQEDLEMRDPLTGLNNRSVIEDYLTQRLTSRRSSTFPVGCLLIDVDNFHAVNDKYGEIMGDEVLKRISKVLLKSCRDEDFIGRYGDNAFVIALTTTDAGGTLIVGEKLLRNVRAMEWADMPLIEGITVSIGATCITRDSGLTLPDLMEIITSQLQQAKETGRDCIIMNARASVRQTAGFLP
ncbi:MAG TPA: PAS domain S-box protein [Chloroflexia bacterium]|jgi:diguanylate cyclase (GGDEF)-like protein/PAS domain S-box-containing protein